MCKVILDNFRKNAYKDEIRELENKLYKLEMEYRKVSGMPYDDEYGRIANEIFVVQTKINHICRKGAEIDKNFKCD